jgi:hypothetical protein
MTTGKVATATLVKTFAYTLVNGGSYGVRVTVWDAKDVPSAAVTRTFVVSFTAPTKPSVVATTDGIRGSITLTVTNPLPDASKAVLHYNDVYRKKASESTCEQIATGIDNNGTFTDYTPASGQQYDYVIRAIGVTGGYSDSDACRTSVSFKHSQLAQASDYSNLVVLPYNPSRKEARRYERVLMEFAGRTSPVAEFGEHDGWALGLGFNILTDADLQALRDIVDLNETLLYRDQRDRREFVSIDTLDIDDQFRPKYYKVGITPDRVSYIEPVFDGDYDASEILFWWFGKTLYDSRWNLPLTFTRASGANEHFAGTAIASGIPNYGPGTEGVLVEEAATPKLANPFFATDGDADGLADSWSKLNAFAEATYSLSTSSYAWGNGKAQKVAINNAAYNDAMLGIRQDFAVSAGDKISIRFACKTNKTVVKARLYDVTGSAVLATMSFTVTPDTKADISYSFAAVPAGCSNARLYFYVTGTAGAWSTSDYVEFYCAHAEAKAYITTPCTAARAAGTLSAANINFPASGPAWCYAVVRPTWASDNPPGTRDKWLSLCFGDVNNLIGVRCVTTAGNPLLFRCTKNGVAKNIDLPTSLSWQAYETIRLLYGQRSTGKFCAVKIADRAIVIVNDTDTSPFVTAPTTHYFGHYQDGNGQINGFVGPDDEATGNITDDQIYAMFEQIVNLASNGDFTKWTRDAHATSSADGQILTLVATDNYQFSTWECPLWPNTSYIVSQECSGRINASHTPSTIGKWLDAAGNSISNEWDEGAAGANGVVTRTLTSPSNAVALRLYASNIGTGTYTFKPFTVTPRKTISAGQNLLVNGGFDKGTNPTGALGLTLHAEANTTAVLGKLQLVATAADHNSYETVYGIVGGASYTHGVTIVGANGVSYVSWYNSSNAFISSSGNINPGTPSQTITAPANAAIAHVNYKSSSAGTFTFDDAILSRNA